MSIRSMTGFAREAGTTGANSWAWELKSVNGRGLDVRVRTPPGFDEVGEDARRRIAAALSRGQCQLGLTVTRGAPAIRVRVNDEVLAGLIAAVSRVSLPASVQPASLDGLLGVRGVVEIEERDDETLGEEFKRDLGLAADRLVQGLRRAREIEGLALATILSRQLEDIGQLVGQAETCPGRQPEAVKARIAEQVALLLDTSQTLDPDRLHQEAALIATRADVREELDRLHAHLDAARALLAGDGPVGRKLDFLAQEFGRETNTLCSKANDVALSRIGLELKAVVEQFREQVQNVE